MKHAFRYFFILTALFFYACEENETTKDEDTSPSSVEIEIVRLVNEHRTGMGLPAMESNDILWKAAREHTQYMIGKKAISHDNFNSRLDAIAKQLPWSGAGENVASGYTSAAAVMTGWLNSAGHKANIEGDFNRIGVAALQDSDGSWYYTQIFVKTNP